MLYNEVLLTCITPGCRLLNEPLVSHVAHTEEHAGPWPASVPVGVAGRYLVRK